MPQHFSLLGYKQRKLTTGLLGPPRHGRVKPLKKKFEVLLENIGKILAENYENDSSKKILKGIFFADTLFHPPRMDLYGHISLVR